MLCPRLRLSALLIAATYLEKTFIITIRSYFENYSAMKIFTLKQKVIVNFFESNEQPLHLQVSLMQQVIVISTFVTNRKIMNPFSFSTQNVKLLALYKFFNTARCWRSVLVAKNFLNVGATNTVTSPSLNECEAKIICWIELRNLVADHQ